MQKHNLFAQKRLVARAETVRRQAFECFIHLISLPKVTSAVNFGRSRGLVPGTVLIGSVVPDSIDGLIPKHTAGPNVAGISPAAG
jgi:hypothetical protein